MEGAQSYGFSGLSRLRSALILLFWLLSHRQHPDLADLRLLFQVPDLHPGAEEYKFGVLHAGADAANDLEFLILSNPVNKPALGWI